MTVFFVAGIPQQQGSKTGWVVGGRAVLFDQNAKQLKPWRAQVAQVAAATFQHRGRLDGPVRVEATFVLPRPKSVKRDRPHVRPDLDKLCRALLDGVTEAGNVWGDDSQVCELVVVKVYGETPGVHVDVTPMRPPKQPEVGQRVAGFPLAG
jgi:Holliday junction resolvase RusA-like endonuclease